MTSPFRRPRNWSVWMFGALLVLAVVLLVRRELLAGSLAAGCALAWLFYGSMTRPDRYNARLVAILTATSTLLVTWTTSLFLAVVYAMLWLPDPGDAHLWIPVMLLVATNVGGVIAVFRSAQTRTETSAALREVSDLRIAVLSAPVIEAADRARQARVFEELAESLNSMLQLAVGLSILPRVVDRASLWARDDQQREWFICAATDVPRVGERFRQPILVQETKGGGIVANFALGVTPPVHVRSKVDGDVYLIGDALADHPWFRVNPSEGRASEGMAIVLVRREREVIGALCFTWESEVIPTEGSQAEEMIDILSRWAHSFSIGINRLYRLRSELHQRQSDVEP